MCECCRSTVKQWLQEPETFGPRVLAASPGLDPSSHRLLVIQEFTLVLH